MFLFATYFGILNIMREGVQHLEQTSKSQTFILEHILDQTAAALATDIAQPAVRLNRRQTVLQLSIKGRCTLTVQWLSSLLAGCRRRCCKSDYGEQIDPRLTAEGKGALKNSLFVKGAGTSKWQIFREEQQAIGDLLVDASKSQCIGYAEFTFMLRQMEKDGTAFQAKIEKDASALMKLKGYIEAGLSQAASEAENKADYIRLQFFQNLLIDTLNILDPGKKTMSIIKVFEGGEGGHRQMHRGRAASWNEAHSIGHVINGSSAL